MKTKQKPISKRGENDRNTKEEPSGKQDVDNRSNERTIETCRENNRGKAIER